MSFAREGAQTVLAASSQANLDAAAGAVGNAGPKPLTFAGDLKTLQACEALHAFVKRKARTLRRAGEQCRRDAQRQFPRDARRGVSRRLRAEVFRLRAPVEAVLADAQGGRRADVVNIIGGAARTPDPLFLVGGSVNAAMANFSKGLSGLGKRDGVNVNVIHPGLTETDRVTMLLQQRAQASGITPDQARKQLMEKDGLRRIGQPDDVAELALFLALRRARASHPGRGRRGRWRPDDGLF